MQNNSISLGDIQDTRLLRLWQLLFINRFFALMQRFFLLVASPGCGKTIAICRVGRRLFEEGRIDRIVVVVPSEHLKYQWMRALSAFGIEIDPKFQNEHCRESGGFHGVAVTYQMVSKSPELHAINCSQSRSLVVFDEPHHTGDNLFWGNAMRIAFDAAEFVILATGTPFRSDENPITFVTYKDGESQPDFSYSYGEALADGACRPVVFSVYDGYLEWIRRNGQEVAHTMSDVVSQEKLAEMLHVALSPTGDWLPAVLGKANDELSNMRANGHPDAAGIVFARDIAHARAIADILRRVTGEEAVIVTSDEEFASQRLKDFARTGNRQPWVVSVRMVIEGVDAPRLRIGVFATNTLTELFFRQSVGRVVRTIPGIDEQTAVMYLPYHPTLIEFALKIREERDHVLSTKKMSSSAGQAVNGAPISGISAGQEFFGEFPGDPGFPDIFGDFDSDEIDAQFDNDGAVEGCPAVTAGAGSATENAASRPPVNNRGSVVPISSEAIEHDTIHGSESFSPVEMTKAEAVRQQVKVTIPVAQIAAILRAGLGNASAAAVTAQVGASTQNNTPAPAANAPTATAADHLTLSERRDKLRAKIRSLTNKLAYRLGVTPDVIHRQWIQEMGGQRAAQAEEIELLSKLEWLKSRIRDCNRRIHHGQRN